LCPKSCDGDKFERIGGCRSVDHGLFGHPMRPRREALVRAGTCSPQNARIGCRAQESGMLQSIHP
jgi:hypothetical protein